MTRDGGASAGWPLKNSSLEAELRNSDKDFSIWVSDALRLEFHGGELVL
jgi:hypothetical protein